ncbi:hypothetical protein S7711_09119 [Stachybotrys chartarum IBT 7711]|uniref:CBM6 domain-containing protein n=1 Tax=Stachybotrys chartarum (strain CBS 109288 / IBT 7711) TaxID=1280523 RepID=A0A084B2Y7_STACB|nr:hypothetical protein S7711_09119 [Stachybotrys chartarum IBT 7711]KFA56350.1 hypothetical protein S40293_08745 [Stachybotrys chartarum IBT 40293]
MRQLSMTDTWALQAGGLSNFVRVEVEISARPEGVAAEAFSEVGQQVTGISNRDYIKVSGVASGDNALSVTASVAPANKGEEFDLPLGSVEETLIGIVALSDTARWQTRKSV